MIIICPSCKKKFEIDQNLIPDTGRLLQCGFCDEKWFFKKNKDEPKIYPTENTNKPNPELLDELLIKSEKINKNDNKIAFTDEKVEFETKNQVQKIYTPQKSYNFSFSKILSYIIVLILTFVGIIIILDTFKAPLYGYFPNLEFFLFSLFETLIDVNLFIKHLF